MPRREDFVNISILWPTWRGEWRSLKEKHDELKIIEQRLVENSQRQAEEEARLAAVRIDKEREEQALQNERIEIQASLDKLREERNQELADRQQILDKIQRTYQETKKSLSLREQPILKPHQEKIKRMKPLQGGLIINGGPGTGKTTTLIQRIAYLTSTALTRDDEFGGKAAFVIDDYSRQALYGQMPNWQFFSPSELLRNYLKDAMVLEGLQATNSNVNVWQGLGLAGKRTEVINSYKLTGEGNPFSNAKPVQRKHGLFRPTREAFLYLHDLFTMAYVERQQTHLSRLISIELTDISWYSFGARIQKDCQSMRREANLTQWAAFYETIKLRYEPQYRQLEGPRSKLVNDLADRLRVHIERDRPDWFSELQTIVDRTEVQQIGDEDNLDEPEEEVAAPVLAETISAKVTRFIQRVIKMGSRHSVDKTQRISVRDQEWYKRFDEIPLDKSIKKNFRIIGELELLRSFFGRLVRGSERNLLSDIVPAYRSFRREHEKDLKEHFQKPGAELFGQLVKEGRLHDDEKDFLIYTINQFIRLLFRQNRSQFDLSSHPFVTGFKIHMRPVVAIDEATDFSPFELAAMASLSHPQFNCVTLSGDLMQRMTERGLSDWNDFQAIIPDTTIETMTISFRQTPRLLAIANRLYEHNTHKPAPFVPNLPDERGTGSAGVY
jgi:hypothetical protein